MLKISNGSYKYKNVGTVDDVMLTCSWIKFIDVPLCISRVVVCIQMSTVKGFRTKGSSHSGPHHKLFRWSNQEEWVWGVGGRSCGMYGRPERFI